MSEAYETLKDPEKRAAYDQLGRHAPGEDFRPPPDWQQSFGEGAVLVRRHRPGGSVRRPRRAAQRGAHAARDMPMPGSDYEAAVRLTFDQAFKGTEIDLDMVVPEFDPQGFVQRVPRKIKVRIPKGVTDGQKLRVPGKGGKGVNGGRDGDLYLDIAVHGAPAVSRDGIDLYMDLPLAPWEAVLGADVELPTPAGRVALKVPAGTRAGQKLRLGGRGPGAPGRHVRAPVRGGADRRADGGRRAPARAVHATCSVIDVQSARELRGDGP